MASKANFAKLVLIKGGRLVDPGNKIDRVQDLLIRDGKIKTISKRIKKDPSFEILEASGCWVVPGLFDMHVHFREPGQEYKETIRTGCEAAANGGFTGVACMPNTEPRLDSASLISFVKKKGNGLACRVYPIGSITKGFDGKELSEYGEMKEAGAVAFSEDGKSVENSQLMVNALRYSSMLKIPILVHCQDHTFPEGSMNEGAISSGLGIRGIPNLVEELGVYRDIQLARYSGAQLHVLHVSTAEGVDLVRNAKKKGLKVTAETATHYLWFTDKNLRGLNPNFKMWPPLRNKKDQQALFLGIKDGTIDILATDHAPHSVDDKEVEFEASSNGIIGLETALATGFMKLVKTKLISPHRFVELMSINPRKILGLPIPSILEGKEAELTVFHPNKKWVVNPKKFKSKGQNCPWNNMELEGKAIATYLEGTLNKLE